jgi:transposase InsO family protein
LVQWDTSEHDWLEGRGEKLYLIAMIDDATSRLLARFVRHDSTEENMKLLWSYLEKFGGPLAFYTDKASIFQTAEKRRRDEPGVDKDPVELPPTQMGRALQELGIAWIAAHSPQAKGRVERNFGTAQDRLVKGMRVAGVKTLEQANQYAELYQIERKAVVSGLRKANVRVEKRLHGSIAVRLREQYLPVSRCTAVAKTEAPVKPATPRRPPNRQCRSEWGKNFDLKKGPKIWQVA